MKKLAKFILIAFGLLIGIVLLLLAVMFWQVQGEHEFSAGDFERVTGQQLPASVKIIAAESLDWDLHGDHDACAVIEISMEDFQQLQQLMDPNDGSEPVPAGLTCSDNMNALFASYKVLAAEYGSAEGGEARYWALVDGKPIVLVKYASW